MLRILNNGNVLADLDNVTSAKIKKIINGVYTLNIEAFEKNLKSQFFEVDNYIEADGTYFDVVYIQNGHKDEISYSMECEHVSYRLIRKAYQDGYVKTGSPDEILAELLGGTDFTPGSSPGPTITINIPEATNAYNILIRTAIALNMEIKYDGFTISIVDEIGTNRGYEVRFGKNQQSVTKHIDKRSGETKVHYEVDVVLLAESDNYKKLGYAELERLELGDTIRLIDEPMNIDTLQPVMALEYDLITKRNTRLDISSKMEAIANTILAIQNDVSDTRASIDITNGTIELLSESVDGNSAAITVANDSIESLVTSTDENYSLIQQQADMIALRVLKDGIIAAINVSPETVAIQANRVAISGYVTFSNLLEEGQTVINGANIKTGKIDAIDIYGSKFYGPYDPDSTYGPGYIKVSGSGNFADLQLYRGGGTHPVFKIMDYPYYRDWLCGNGSLTPTSFLQTGAGTASPQGSWNFSNATVTGLDSLTTTAKYA